MLIWFYAPVECVSLDPRLDGGCLLDWLFLLSVRGCLGYVSILRLLG